MTMHADVTSIGSSFGFHRLARFTAVLTLVCLPAPASTSEAAAGAPKLLATDAPAAFTSDRAEEQWDLEQRLRS